MQLNVSVRFLLNLVKKKVFIPSPANKQNKLGLMEGSSEGHRAGRNPYV